MKYTETGFPKTIEQVLPFTFFQGKGRIGHIPDTSNAHSFLIKTGHICFSDRFFYLTSRFSIQLLLFLSGFRFFDPASVF